MANYAETSKNFTGQFMTSLAGVNTGLIIPWGAASVPSGFLECNGAAVSRATYAALFAVVSTTYGIGDGTTTFNLPDLTDRTVVNKSNNKSLAQTGGANTVVAAGNVSGNLANYTLSSSEIAAHTHSQWKLSTGMSPTTQQHQNAGFSGGGSSSSTGGGGAHTHTLSGTSFTGDATSVLQPYLVLIYIIKT